MKIRKCGCCATPLPSPKTRGRPREFCSDECRKLSWLMGHVEREVNKFLTRLPTDEEGTVTPDGLKSAARIKSSLWAAGNLTNYAGRQARAR